MKRTLIIAIKIRWVGSENRRSSVWRCHTSKYRQLRDEKSPAGSKRASEGVKKDERRGAGPAATTSQNWSGMIWVPLRSNASWGVTGVYTRRKKKGELSLPHIAGPVSITFLALAWANSGALKISYRLPERRGEPQTGHSEAIFLLPSLFISF